MSLSGQSIRSQPVASVDVGLAAITVPDVQRVGGRTVIDAAEQGSALNHGPHGGAGGEDNTGESGRRVRRIAARGLRHRGRGRGWGYRQALGWRNS